MLMKRKAIGVASACLFALAPSACSAGDDLPVQPLPSVPPGTPIWPAPAKEKVAQLIRNAGLDDTSGDRQTIMWIAHLDVFSDGAAVPVPPNLGIDFVTSIYSPVHTHLYGGFVHVESPVVKPFKLGQLFTLWEVPLTGATAYVNGQAAPDAAGVLLADKQEIAVVFGKPPATIPSAFPLQGTAIPSPSVAP